MGRLSLDNTPLIIVTPPLIVGIALGMTDVAWWICGIVLGVGVAAGVLLRKKSGFAIPLFGVAGFCLGMVSVGSYSVEYDNRVEIIAQCDGSPTVRGRWQTFDAQIFSYCDSIGGWHDEKCAIKLSVDTSERGIDAGTVLSAKGRLRRMDGSYGASMMRLGIVGRFYGYDVKIVGRDSSLYYRCVNGINGYRERIAQRIYAIDTSNIEGTSIIAALTVGERGAIPKDINVSYRRSGTSHLLSISGLHVGIIFIILNLILGSIRIVRRGQLIFGIIVIATLWCYTLFSGMSPATIRATIMFTMFQMAIISSRGATSLNVLCFSALVLVLINPHYVFDIGFQLSYMAMVGIALLYAPILSVVKIKNPILRAVWSVTAISIAAQVAVAPLVALTFSQIPLAGIVVNIAVWLTVPIIIGGAMLFLIFGNDFIGQATLWVSDIQNDIISYTASKSWVVVESPISPLTAGILYAILLAMMVYINHLYNQKINRHVEQVGSYPL